MMKALPVFFIFLLHSAHALKFLAYNPVFARSHVTFIGALADALVDAGHEVHMLAPIIDSRIDSYGTKKATIIRVPQSNSSLKYEREIEGRVARNLWHNEGIVREIEATLFDHIDIDKYAAALSIASSEGLFEFTGAQSFPSYVPTVLGVHGDRMSFFERMHNLLNHLAIQLFLPSIFQPYDAMFARRFGERTMKVKDLLRKASLYFVNSEPLIDFPKILTHKIIDIGGISVSSGHAPLNEARLLFNDTWSTILERRSKNVLISFGTVAKSHLMPAQYKKSVVNTVKRFPNVTFIWKYERPEDRISDGIDNLIESPWVPQSDLLHDSRLSLFITHCGQGSTIEAVTAGIPLIAIPVLGDQQRNAQVIKRIGTGIVLEKTSLMNSQEMELSIQLVFEQGSFNWRDDQKSAVYRKRIVR